MNKEKQYSIIIFLIFFLVFKAKPIIKFSEAMAFNVAFNEKKAASSQDWQDIINSYHESLILKNTYSSTPKIPKIIHQIWIGSELPEKYNRFVQTWIAMHPDWEYRLWSHQDILNLPLQNRDLYLSAKNYGEKSDIARYEILYLYGGLYVDTDFECLKSFDEFHHICDFYAGLTYGAALQLLNGLIGCAPSHPILKECLDNLKGPKNPENLFLDVLERTGPVHLTRSYLKRYAMCDGICLILPPLFFYPWPWMNRDQNSPEEIRKWIHEDSYAIHHWHVSWNNGQTKK